MAASGRHKKKEKITLKARETQLLLMEMMVLRQGVKEIAGKYLFSSSFILANVLFRIILFVMMEKSSNSESRRPTENEKLGLQYKSGFETVMDSYSVSFLCLWNSWVGLALREGTAKSDDLGFFDLLAGSFWKEQMLRLGVPVWCLSGRENPFLISFFPAEAQELDSACSQKGKGNNAKFQPNFWANPCQWQRNGRGFYPGAAAKGKRIHAFW